MYVHLNGHAVMAWMYVVETVRRCAGEVATNNSFARLVVGLQAEYPDELEYVLRNFRLED
jgi:hypothetical protein